MYILILIIQVGGYWEIYFSGFHQASNIYCNNNACPYQFKKNLELASALYSNCTNPMGTALVLNSKQMLTVLSEATNNLKSNSKSHTLSLDLYFLTQWNEGEFMVEYKQQKYSFKYSTQDPLQFGTGGCNLSFHQVRTIQLTLQDMTALQNLKFSILNNQNEVLIRNVHLSYLTCHPTCKTCSGENQNECTSCFGGVNLVNGFCRCPIRTVLSGEPPSNYRCLKFCLLSFADKRKGFCKAYEIQYVLFLQLQSYSYTQLIKWNIIYDPKNLNNQNKKLGPYFGIFKNNEGAQITVNTTQFLYPLTAQIYILMCNATPINSGISIYLNSTYYSSFYFDGTQFLTDNLYLFAYNTGTFTGCQTAKSYLLSSILYVEQGNFIFSLKGNFTNSNSGWYIIYSVLAGSQCPAFCLKCEREYDCSICQTGYKKVSDGRCALNCPKDSTFTNNICLKNDQITKYSQYFIKLFSDFTVPNNVKDIFILESSNEKDFQKGDFIYWSYIETKAVFGGKYVWATAKFSQKYTILKPHHSLTIYFDAIFGCNFQIGAGYLGYSINNNTESQVNKNQTITINIPHPSSILYIAFKCYGLNNNVLDKYCALSDYSIIVHYCSPFCLECTNENTCILMDTYDNSIVKIDQSECGPQQFLDTQYYRCEYCPQECEACFNEYECTQCYYPYKLYITKCLLMCTSNQYFNELNNVCEDCGIKCKQCRNDRDWCIHCEEQNFRVLHLNQCICHSGYYDDNTKPQCQLCHNLCKQCYGSSNKACTECIQLDKIELNGNICDCQEGYYFDNSKYLCQQCNNRCKTCFFSSENSCLSCINDQNRSLQGLQCICQIGYYEIDHICQQCPVIEDTLLSQCYKICGNNLTQWHNNPCDQVTCLTGFENVNNICIPICGDLQINGYEECDDGNQELNDGCMNCKFQCPSQCKICDQHTVLPCLDTCGDGIISGFEECDDGNNIQYDGCYQCKLDCQIQCTKCMRGLCYECQTYGWEINIETLRCIENCGDSIVIGNEECDDGYNLDENDNCYKCKRLCRNDCKTCTSDGKTCYDCKVVGFKPQSYYCVNICGDGYLAIDPYGRNTEECDDFNLTNYDGCSSTCKFQCQNDVCKVCQNRKCVECIDHYYTKQYFFIYISSFRFYFQNTKYNVIQLSLILLNQFINFSQDFNLLVQTQNIQEQTNSHLLKKKQNLGVFFIYLIKVVYMFDSYISKNREFI